MSLRRLWGNLTAEYVAVKPVMPNRVELFGWVEVRGSLWDQVRDDWRRFGWWVTLLNLWDRLVWNGESV